MDAIKLEFDVCTTDAECRLGVRVSIDNNIICDNPHVTETIHISHELDDADAQHVLAIELYGKLPEHTKVDDEGNIVKDVVITVENMHIDGIDVSQIATNLIEYHHDYNNSRAPCVDKFYNSMGCNGTALLKFATPVYLWLLENM